MKILTSYAQPVPFTELKILPGRHGYLLESGEAGHYIFLGDNEIAYPVI